MCKCLFIAHAGENQDNVMHGGSTSDNLFIRVDVETGSTSRVSIQQTCSIDGSRTVPVKSVYHNIIWFHYVLTMVRTRLSRSMDGLR